MQTQITIPLTCAQAARLAMIAAEKQVTPETLASIFLEASLEVFEDGAEEGATQAEKILEFYSPEERWQELQVRLGTQEAE